jgi:GT2 family glycosyltransferase
MRQLRSEIEVGMVVIGRNEGERLKRCLASAAGSASIVVYVDSGSTDGSSEYARSIGVEVVDLDMRVPFTAGRARNAGYSHLAKLRPLTRFVQFIDGDCELFEDWIHSAIDFLSAREEYAIVAGRLKERDPEASVYNTLCDAEWTRPEGDASSCGGIFMARAAAFSECGGFNETMIAGEEPELCFRLRRSGWKLYSLAKPMATHDADMRRFSQWWKRSVRSGYAYAHRYALHFGENEKDLRKATLRVWFWGAALPVSALALAAIAGPWAATLLLAYLYQLLHGYSSSVNVIRNRRVAFLYSVFNLIGKWAQLVGEINFLAKALQKKDHNLIEYK